MVHTISSGNKVDRYKFEDAASRIHSIEAITPPEGNLGTIVISYKAPGQSTCRKSLTFSDYKRILPELGFGNLQPTFQEFGNSTRIENVPVQDMSRITEALISRLVMEELIVDKSMSLHSYRNGDSGMEDDRRQPHLHVPGHELHDAQVARQRAEFEERTRRQ